MKLPISLFLFLLVTSNLPLALCQALCDFFKYRAPGSTQCVRCPSCPPGQEITTHCGYTKYGQTGPACKPCTKGQTFSDKHSLECQLCRVYCPIGMRILKECTLATDTKCVKDCPPGFFVNSDGGCSKCSFCCGDKWQRSGFVQKACLNAGMGRCSCAPRKECKPPQGTCLQTTLTPPSPTTSETVLNLRKAVYKPTSSRLRERKRHRLCKRRCRRKRKLTKKCFCNPKRKHQCRGRRKRKYKCFGKNKRKRKCKRKKNRARKFGLKLSSKNRKRNHEFAPTPTSPVKEIQVDVEVTGKRHKIRKVPLPTGEKVQKRSIDLFRV